MSSPLEHPGWAGVGAWCQASSPDKWPLSTLCRMFHSSRPEQPLPAQNWGLLRKARSPTSSDRLVCMTSIWEISQRQIDILQMKLALYCHCVADDAGWHSPWCASWQWTQSQAPPRGPPAWSPASDVRAAESVISGHHQGRLCSFAC